MYNSISYRGFIRCIYIYIYNIHTHHTWSVSCVSPYFSKPKAPSWSKLVQVELSQQTCHRLLLAAITIAAKLQQPNSFVTRRVEVFEVFEKDTF